MSRAASVVLVFVCGCVSNDARPQLDVTSTQPATMDMQQLAGQVVTGVLSRIEAAGVRGDATGYRSEFGVGAALVVSLALVLSLILSHRREMERIKRGRSRP